MDYLLHNVFTQTVRSNPNRIAIVMESTESITYSELNKLANRFYHFFASHKTNRREQPFIGILSAVHIYSIAAVLGALKGGYAYVPLDEHSPASRLQAIISHCKLDIIVIDACHYEKFRSLLDMSCVTTGILLTDGTVAHHEKVVTNSSVISQSDHEPPAIPILADDLAYVLHSSGSTGIPKGIMLSHRNARTFVNWMHKEFQLTKNDRVMSRAPFKFDLSVFDIFNTLKAGASLICFEWSQQRVGDEQHCSYVELMVRENATILYTTPSTLIALLNRGNLSHYKEVLALTRIMYAGEPFPLASLKRLKTLLSRARIANIYGPTETNIITYYWIDEIADDLKDIPLGQVVDDTEIIVVNEEGSHLCKPNEVGEIWCRGGTVTLGYLGMDEKTKECKVNSPFHFYPAEFWKTGDYGYYDGAGILHYRGRKDHMIKVKGYRIEIGEIETALSNHEDLDEFAVVAKPDERYGNRLYCFYSLLPNSQLSENELNNFLHSRLPSYMIPFKYFNLKLLPKTSSGKIDRIRLAETIDESLYENTV